MVLDEEASQVIDYPNEAQLTNVTVVNCLWPFRQGIEDILSAQKLTSHVSLSEVDRLCASVLDPLGDSIKDSVEAILLTIHNEEEFNKDVSSRSAHLRKFYSVTFFTKKIID